MRREAACCLSDAGFKNAEPLFKARVSGSKQPLYADENIFNTKTEGFLCRYTKTNTGLNPRI